VLDDYQGYSRRFADWGALAGGVTVFQEKIPPGDLVERLAPFDVICVMRERTPIPATRIRSPGLFPGPAARRKAGTPNTVDAVKTVFFRNERLEGDSMLPRI